MLKVQKKFSNFLVANCPLPGSLAAKTEACDLWFTSQKYLCQGVLLLFSGSSSYRKDGTGKYWGHGGSM